MIPTSRKAAARPSENAVIRLNGANRDAATTASVRRMNAPNASARVRQNFDTRTIGFAISAAP